MSVRRAWAASYGLAPPKADFETVLRNRVRQLATVDPAVAEGLAHIVRNRPYFESYFASPSQPARVQFFSNSKSIFNHLDQPEMEEWEIAEAGAMISAFAAKHAGGNSSSMQDRLYSQKMQQWSLGNAARAHSSSCNPALSAGTRQQNNCFSPIPVPGLP